MTDFVRTDDAHFDALSDWNYELRYHQWKDLRVHCIDEGPSDAPVMLLLHGMPTWAYLYRTMIPSIGLVPLLAAASSACATWFPRSRPASNRTSRARLP
ncbi:hypothetical protein [Candidatus Poriferisodalis sp.]|uniref:hypothetical protein n=1 Tax=Candidatus Poriferisodalis sp. TaxID=3101277 RepID=UPI003C6FDDCB